MENLDKNGSLSIEDAMPLMLKSQFNHIAHLDQDMVTKVEFNALANKVENMVTKVEFNTLANKVENMVTKDQFNALVNKVEMKFEAIESKFSITHWMIGLGFTVLGLMLGFSIFFSA